VHLLNLAVAPAHRRRGLGAALYDETAAALRVVGARVMFLEVRPSNEAALALYRSRGLEVVGRRRRYYADNGEDAIVMAGEVE
ncbi:MAG: GNAT family N-acetyltransferase, partial [Candidatus Methylomirabilis sp.]|nr:GNAT family N-acetyltransferase [Deltaproteobacteria bacterium]